MWGSGERQRYIERRVRETERQGEAETEREETEIHREAERDREEEREREKKIRGKRCDERERDRDTEAGYRLEPLSWRKGLSEAPFRCAWSSPSLDEGTVRHQGVWKNVFSSPKVFSFFKKFPSWFFSSRSPRWPPQVL